MQLIFSMITLYAELHSRTTFFVTLCHDALCGFPLNNLRILFLFQPEPKSTETCHVPDYQLGFRARKQRSRKERNKPELHLNLVKRQGLLVKQSIFEITTLKTETKQVQYVPSQRHFEINI